MFICNKYPLLAAFAVSGASLCVGACFDVKQVEVTNSAPVVLDDFEDGDQVPKSELFSTWQCYPFQADAAPPTCGAIAPGFGGGQAEALTFELDTPVDMSLASKVGVGLILLPDLPLNLATWQKLSFDAKFDASAPGVLEEPDLLLRLKCPDAPHAHGLEAGGFQVEHSVQVGKDWATFTVPWSEFQQSPFQDISIVASECIAHVDGLAFEIGLVDDQSGVANGQSGTLTLDNVSLE